MVFCGQLRMIHALWILLDFRKNIARILESIKKNPCLWFVSFICFPKVLQHSVRMEHAILDRTPFGIALFSMLQPVENYNTTLYHLQVILRKKPSTTSSSPTSSTIPTIQHPPPARRAPAETGKEPRSVIVNKHPAESYGLSLGSILFVKDLDPRGPAGQDGQLELGDVILKVL